MEGLRALFSTAMKRWGNELYNDGPLILVTTKWKPQNLSQALAAANYGGQTIIQLDKQYGAADLVLDPLGLRLVYTWLDEHIRELALKENGILDSYADQRSS